MVVNSAGVWVGGDRVGDAPSDGSATRARLRERLFEYREAAKAGNASDAAPSAIRISLLRDTTCSAGMGVLEVVRLAGIRSAIVDLAGTSREVLLSDPGAPVNPPVEERRLGAHLGFKQHGEVEVRLDTCLAPYDVVPAAAVGTLLESITKDRLGAVAIHCDDDIPLRDAIAVFDASALRSAGGAAGTAAPSLGIYAEPGCGTGASRDDWDPAWSDAPALTPPRPGTPDPGVHVMIGALRASNVADETAAILAARTPIQSTQDELARCFAAGSPTPGPTSRGSVFVTLLLGRSGHVAAFTKTEASLPDRAVVACVRQELGAVVFEPPSAPGELLTVPVGFVSVSRRDGR